MAKAHQCTICGVSFGKPSQVRAHIQGSGGEHAGIGFADAEQYISDAQEIEADDADPPAGPPADPPSSPSSTEGLGVPDKHVTTPKPEQKDDPTCPECGSNRWFDASEHTNHQYGCAECSSATSWQVYSL